MRTATFLALVVTLAGGSAAAQTADAPRETSTATQAEASQTDEKPWSFDASVYTYLLPDSGNYAQPTFATDHRWLHLEARVNYEDLDTGSAWVGYTFRVGTQVTFELTPMVGAVFGNTNGVAPGYKGSLAWRALDLSSETEYVFDAGDSADNFLYTWSELAVAPVDWCRVGFVVQRTKVYQTAFDIQRGFFGGFSYKRAEVTGYVFNPDASPTVVIAVGFSF